MVAQVKKDFERYNRTLALLNFMDFHAPNLDYASPDFDRAMYNLVDTLEKSGKPFRMLLVGDHGHGLLSELGDAAAVLFTNRDEDTVALFHEIERSPVLTHFTMNKFLLGMLGGYCASHGIPFEYCGKCSYGTSLLHDWTVSFEFNHAHGHLTTDQGAESTLNFNSTTITVKISRQIICQIGRDLGTVYGIQLSLNVERELCSSFFNYDYGGKLIISTPSSQYSKFYKCAKLKSDDIYITLKKDGGVKGCISLKEMGTARNAFLGETQTQCKDLTTNTD